MGESKDLSCCEMDSLHYADWQENAMGGGGGGMIACLLRASYSSSEVRNP